MIAFALLSLLCSMFMFVTAWLVLPLVVLFPLSCFFALKCYKQTMTRFPDANIMVRLIALVPLLIAILTVPAALVFINANYQA